MMVGLPLLFVSVTIPFHPSVQEWRFSKLKDSIAEVDTMMEEGQLNLAFQEVSDLETRLPYRMDQLRRQALLSRIQLLARMNKPDLARADCRRLEFLSLPDSGLHFLARGINILLHGERLDFAIQNLERAVELAPDLPDARKWLARAFLPGNPDAALPHLRELFRMEDTLENFLLYITTLSDLDRPGEIWDAMLEQKRPPEDWPAEALRIGADAAERLGKTQRASRLRELLEEQPPA